MSAEEKLVEFLAEKPVVSAEDKQVCLQQTQHCDNRFLFANSTGCSSADTAGLFSAQKHVSWHASKWSGGEVHVSPEDGTFNSAKMLPK